MPELVLRPIEQVSSRDMPGSTVTQYLATLPAERRAALSAAACKAIIRKLRTAPEEGKPSEMTGLVTAVVRLKPDLSVQCAHGSRLSHSAASRSNYNAT